MTRACMLVTGAAGFIGSHLCERLLERGHNIVGIDNFDPFYSRQIKSANIERIRRLAMNSRDSQFELVEADICDAQAMCSIIGRVRPGCVMHMAALAGVRPSIESPARYARVNVDGLITVLDAARAVDCRNMVFASSSSVYGNNSRVPFSEDDPVDKPISPYAATKRAGELMCHTYAHLFGMRIAALRFFTVYGPSQRPDLAIAKFMRLIAAGEEVPMYGDGSTSRDYTFIDDIIQGVLASYELVNSNPQMQRPGELADGGFFRIYNLGNSHPIPLSEMIHAIAQVVGKPARITRLPMQPGDVEQTCADICRSARELGLAPTTCFIEGLRRQWTAVQG